MRLRVLPVLASLSIAAAAGIGGPIAAGGSRAVTVPPSALVDGGGVAATADHTARTSDLQASGMGSVAPSRRTDFDGDHAADIAVYRAATGTWFSLDSSSGNTTYRYRGWGNQAQGDVPVLGDFDGDGIADPTVFRPATGTWFILESHAAFTTWNWFGWGSAGDILVPADYDGDGRTDAAVYRAATGTWYVRPSSGATPWNVGFGQAGDVPLYGDFDGDERADVAVYRPGSGTWFWLKSSDAWHSYDYRGWGDAAQGDLPVPGDYDGDGRTDLCVFRPASGTWFVLETHAGFTTVNAFGWGAATDLLVPADFDGDGMTDAAIYRRSTGEWFVRPSSGAASWSVVFGQAGDAPLSMDFGCLRPPEVAAISPPSVTAGASAFLLTVTGAAFDSGSKVTWNGVQQATTFVNSTELRATIGAALVAYPGTASVGVWTRTASSNAKVFTIDPPPPPTPSITRLTPSITVAGGPGFDLQVYGANFVPASVVRWNGSARYTVFLSSKQLRATITAADIVSAGTYPVTVTSGGSAISSAVSFTVSTPAPVLASISPVAVLAGHAAFDLQAYGTGFLPGSVVQWNGAAKATVFVSGSQLVISVPAADVASAGTISITVRNPDGATSSAKPLQISAP